MKSCQAKRKDRTFNSGKKFVIGFLIYAKSTMCIISEDSKIEFLKNVKKKMCTSPVHLVVEREHDITICFEFQDLEFLALKVS